MDPRGAVAVVGGGGMNKPPNPLPEGIERRCDWCVKPAAFVLEIAPGQYKMVTMIGPRGVPISAPQATRFAIHAFACADHRDIRDHEAGSPLPDPRRRRAKGVQQLDIFGGSTADPRKPGNALTDL